MVQADAILALFPLPPCIARSRSRPCSLPSLFAPVLVHFGPCAVLGPSSCLDIPVLASAPILAMRCSLTSAGLPRNDSALAAVLQRDGQSHPRCVCTPAPFSPARAIASSGLTVKKTLRHTTETYQRPWTLEVQQLIAFVFGLIGHAGADTPWHSLGHNGGLIQSMEYAEFGQDYQAAHTRADIGPRPCHDRAAQPCHWFCTDRGRAGGLDDGGSAHSRSHTGGEFVIKHAGDLDYVEREWLTPAEDMAAIYARTGRTAVTPEDISFCMQLGFLGIWANRVRCHMGMP